MGKSSNLVFITQRLAQSMMLLKVLHPVVQTILFNQSAARHFLLLGNASTHSLLQPTQIIWRHGV